MNYRLPGTIGYTIGVRAGGRGGLQPPQPHTFWAAQTFLDSERKFGQNQFFKAIPCF